MDSFRNELLVIGALALGISFTMGALGAKYVTSRIELRRQAEAEAVDRELDQLQEAIDDLEVSVRDVDARLDRIEKLLETMPVESVEDPS